MPLSEHGDVTSVSPDASDLQKFQDSISTTVFTTHKPRIAKSGTYMDVYSAKMYVRKLEKALKKSWKHQRRFHTYR
jgi:hypothetical protein